MMIALHPTYTLRVELQDSALGSRQFANGLEGTTGCDEVVKAVKKALEGIGIPYTVRLEKFENRANL